MKSRRRGTALIEFAGSLILITTAFTGIFQLGHAFYTYDRLVNAVREGGRYAALQTGVATGDVGRVRKMVAFGDPAALPGTPPLVPGLTEDKVQVIVEPQTTTVTLRGYELPGLFATVHLDGKPSVTFPHARPAQ